MPHGRRHVTQDDPQRDGDPAGVGVHAIVVPLWQQVDVVVPQRKTCQSDCSKNTSRCRGTTAQNMPEWLQHGKYYAVRQSSTSHSGCRETTLCCQVLSNSTEWLQSGKHDAVRRSMVQRSATSQNECSKTANCVNALVMVTALKCRDDCAYIDESPYL